MHCPYKLDQMRIYLVTIVCLSILIANQASSLALGIDRLDEEMTVVVMRGREFLPDRTLVHHGRKTLLRFQNHDSELHAVVPVGWLTGSSFTISGNGAPEFGPDGLKRVIIPAGGLADIRFTPSEPGEYRYFCDMPGHQMNAVLMVE